jgi:DNA-binding NarL/FixJ family response regulator
MLTMVEDEDQVVACLAAGALGYVLKGVGGGNLVQAILCASERRGEIGPGEASGLLSADTESRGRPRGREQGSRRLSELERRYLEAIRDGTDQAAMPGQLGVEARLVDVLGTSILINRLVMAGDRPPAPGGPRVGRLN